VVVWYSGVVVVGLMGVVSNVSSVVSAEGDSAVVISGVVMAVGVVVIDVESVGVVAAAKYKLPL
jgi:hypothetical protein